MAVQVRWLGYAFFEIITEKGRKILIDPYITGGKDYPPNKDSPIKEIEDIKDADLVLVTHGSPDHGLYDAPEIVKNTGATLCCGYDVEALAREMGVKEEQISFICHGNVRELLGLKIRGMEVVHGSWVKMPDGSLISYEPMGFIVHTESDFRIYHLGDSSIIRDFELFGQLYRPNLLLIPVGGAESLMGLPQLYYNEAVLATLWLSPDIAVPMHYEAQEYPLAEKYVECLRLLAAPIKTVTMKPGEAYSFDLKIKCEKVE